MQVTLNIPDVIAQQLAPDVTRISRVIVENLAAQAYRSGVLSSREVSVLLGHDSRWETEDFLSAHDAWPGLSVDEAAEDSRALSCLLAS
ncbi:MAG: UPF0175 family protein [Verrucomicrobiota bacterium]|jgi:hypothetical protein|nr:UPF0175 family protein [Verrucomicrobiota bacterium]